MPFWTDQTDIATPKRNFRFKVTFSPASSDADGFGSLGNTGYWVKTATKPGYSLGVTEHAYLNHTFKFPGRLTWNDVTITMVDPGGATGVGYYLAKMLKDAGYVVPSNSGVFDTMSKNSVVSNNIKVTIEQIDESGQTVEAWTLFNAFISEASFGSLDYGSDELTEYSITLKYDWAQLDDVQYLSTSTGTGTTGTA